jgi:probable HAF family extracellular repeat protein
MIQPSLRAVAAVVAAVITCWGARAGGADQAVMITLPAGVLPSAVGANGSMVAGGLRAGGGFYWMPTTGVVYIGGNYADGVSLDGRTIVGDALDRQNVEQAAIWLRSAEWRLLGSVVPNAAPCDALLSTALDTSNDGRVVVGLAWNGCNFARAFRWEESTGMVDLGSTVANRSSRANGVSGNGQVVVGWQEHSTGPRLGARWVGGRQTIFTGATEFVGEAWAANTDGTLIVGQLCRGGDSTDQSAWVWTPAAGVVCLPAPRIRLPLGNIGSAFDTSEDGRVIGGTQGFGLEREAVIWLDRAPHFLKDYLRANGVPDAFEGWVNTGAITAVSRDGRVVAGYGAGPRDFTGFIIILPSLGDAK